MPRRLTIETVWKMGLALPGVERGTTYGTPALKARGCVLACVPTNRAAEPGSLIVNVPMNERAALLEEQPDVYYLPDHYKRGPYILVRLSRIRHDAMHGLLAAAHRRALTTPRAAARRRGRARR
jgi:hypothetical protein